MIITFNDFINENFQFEHDVEKEFDYLNKLLFNGEVIYPKVSFDPHKIKIAWVSFKDGIVLHFNKNFILPPDQFRNVLAHEMIHLFLEKKPGFRDYGGDHGVFFTREMDRINNMNIGIKISPRDSILPSQQRIKKEKDYYVIFFNWKDEKILCPFFELEVCEEFWETAIKSLKMFSPKGTITLYMAKTNLSEIGFYIVARKSKRVKQQMISDELYDKLLKESEIIKKEDITK